MLMLQRRLLLGVLLGALIGCGSDDGLNRVILSGQVRLKGQPVEDGQIRFIPQEGTIGPVTIESIRSGKYICQSTGGVPAGTHRVEILAWDPKTPFQGNPGSPPRPQWAPAKYNTKSQLVIKLEKSPEHVIKDFEL